MAGTPKIATSTAETRAAKLQPTTLARLRRSISPTRLTAPARWPNPIARPLSRISRRGAPRPPGRAEAQDAPGGGKDPELRIGPFRQQVAGQRSDLQRLRAELGRGRQPGAGAAIEIQCRAGGRHRSEISRQDAESNTAGAERRRQIKYHPRPAH